MRKEELKKVYLATIDTVNDGYYEIVDGEEEEVVSIMDEETMCQGTEFYGKKVSIQDIDSLKKYDTTVIVENNDCLVAAKGFIDEGLRPCVLNMASFHTPGGGVLNGSKAQEEDIFRRTNIFKSLYQFSPIGDEFGVEQKEEQYPLERTYGAIYTPNVTVFKNGVDKGYSFLKTPFQIDVISCAAVKNPTLVDGKLPKWAAELMTEKIRQIFNISLVHGNDSLILSAFGCGAYKNPPHDIAAIFKKVIEEFDKCFKKISFAILELEGTSFKEHNPNGNLVPFQEVLQQKM